MCVMSHFVISYRGDRSRAMSITMMEEAMKTGGWEKGCDKDIPVGGRGAEWGYYTS